MMYDALTLLMHSYTTGIARKFDDVALLEIMTYFFFLHDPRVFMTYFLYSCDHGTEFNNAWSSDFNTGTIFASRSK